MLNNDVCLIEFGIIDVVKVNFDSYVWNFSKDEENIEKFVVVNIGIVYGEYGLVELGGIVLFVIKDNGCLISLFLIIFIVVVCKSKVLLCVV